MPDTLKQREFKGTAYNTRIELRRYTWDTQSWYEVLHHIQDQDDGWGSAHSSGALYDLDEAEATFDQWVDNAITEVACDALGLEQPT